MLETLPMSFTMIYKDLSNSTVGLLFIAAGIGNIIGALSGGKISDVLRKATIQREQERLDEISRRTGQPRQEAKVAPENRLLPSIFGTLVICIAYPIYGILMQGALDGWNINIFLPLAALLVVGFGNMFIMTSTSTFIVDAFQKNSSSAMSVNSMVRSVLAGVVTLFATQWQLAMGIAYVMSIVALISLVLMLPVIFILLRVNYWQKLRARILPDWQ